MIRRSLRSRAVLGLAAVVLLLGQTSMAFAQSWPTRPITLVVPFPPGGPTDITARALARRVGETLGQTVIVDNRPGVSGSLAVEQVVRGSAPDGYTVLYVSTGAMGANLLMYKTLKYDPLKDLVPVHGAMQSATMLVVDAAKPYKTVAEFIQYAKDHPGQLNLGSPGSGSMGHLAGELFQMQTGTRFVHVPYKGAAPALQDMLGGRIDLIFDYGATVMPHVKSGRFRVLAIMGPKRFDAFPDAPTIVEAGFPGLQATAWTGVVVPTGTSPEIVRKLSAAVHTALIDKEVVGQFVSTGADALSEMDEVAFKAFIIEEQKKWAEVVIKSGATAN